MKRHLKSPLSLLLLFAILFSLASPALAADVEQPVEVSLVRPVERIETRHIQDLDVQARNTEQKSREIRLVTALVDYKGGMISRSVSQLTLGAEGTAAATEHVKILPKAYEVRIFAESLGGSVVSNVIRVPIKGGFSIKDIASIRTLRVSVPQWSAFTMPEMLEATMYTGEVEYVPVVWDNAPDLTRAGVYTLTGHVDGYSSQKVAMTVTVLAADKIVGIEPVTVTVDQGTPYSLPMTVRARMYSGQTAFVPVSWEGTASTAQPGTFSFTGTAIGWAEPVRLTLTVTGASPDAVYSFQNADLEEVTAYELGCEPGTITRRQLASITELDASYLGDPDLTDLRQFTGLKRLTLWMSGVEDLSPLSALTGLEKLDLYGNETLEDIAPLFELRSLRSLKLKETAVTDFSPVAPYYDALTERDFTLTMLEADRDGNAALSLSCGQTYRMPFCIKLWDGSYARMEWDQREIPPQEEGELAVTGRVLGAGTPVTVYCTVTDKEDYPIVWHDEALEKGVRKAIDKPKGTVYYSDVKYLRELDCFALGIHSLEDLQHMHNLTYLGVAANYLDDSQWKYIKHLTKLEYLDVAMNSFTVLPAGIFNNMSNLIEICADENKITRIEPGAFLGQEDLDTLMLEENYGLTSISEVRNIPGLKNLFIGRTPVSSLEPLRELQDLEELWADECPIRDISMLAGKTKLTRVKIGNSKNAGAITDISALRDAENLYWVVVSGNQISDISCLEGKSKLKFLDAGYNQISNVSALESCTALEMATLKNNNITDVTPLGNMKSITSLYLQYNRIADVKPLKKLAQLKNLYLAGNPVTDFSPLREIYEKLIGKDFYV